jgi:type I restriction-modification system DNA methylase subunit
MHDVLQTDLFPKSRLSLDALSVFSDATAEDRGAVHTRPEVAEFILDAVGWVESEPLESLRLLEPSAGEGDFLLPAVQRLISRVSPDDLAIEDCIRAVEVNHAALRICRERIERLLIDHAWSVEAIETLLSSWLLHDDFLSVHLDSTFSHVVGNPPYIRLENLPGNRGRKRGSCSLTCCASRPASGIWLKHGFFA